jgi:ubiquinone/menaquinone biosynthesis C-methylase UbiE
LDRLKFYYDKRKNSSNNRAFLKEYPDVALPPDYLMYESFGLDYRNYYIEGRETARWIISIIANHTELNNLKILDWGCGPGRIVRHLPELLPDTSTVYATDYNPESIPWCSSHIKGVEFNKNDLKPELPYKTGTFGALYGLSIFTHLSEEMHFGWMLELSRVLDNGGIALLTTQGDNYKNKMTAAELKRFEKGELVVRGKVKEGHRTFSAFQPDSFMMSLFEKCGLSVVEKVVIEEKDKNYTPQDVWVVRKKEF